MLNHSPPNVITTDDLSELQSLLDETLVVVTSMLANDHFTDLNNVGQGAMLFLVKRQLERMRQAFKEFN